MLKVFLDANIYFAGFHSTEGASSLILKIAARQKVILYSSKLVLREAERNLRLKSKKGNLKAFHRYLQKTKIHVTPYPDEKFAEPFEALIHPKDLAVLGAALMTKSDFLITLDKRHFFTPMLQSKLPRPKIMIPGGFIVQIYAKGKI